MAWLNDTTAFDPDAYEAEVIGLATSLSEHDSGAHSHGRGQLLYARRGCIRITMDTQLCLLPPSRAVWIPPVMLHRAVMHRVVDYRSLYFRLDIAATMPPEVRVIDVSPLLRAVMEPIAQADFGQTWASGRYAHLLALCIDEICAAPCTPMLLPLPNDRRLAKLIEHPENLPPELHVLETQVGASARTITRIFQKETGMSYQAWRQQWRVMRAIEWLSTGLDISRVASELQFSSDSAFIAFFRNMVGETPKAYLREQQQRIRE
ncbi:AraC family transcriptional regulator [Paraburkholderia oxyphila]|uniref:AraC family transcriptional regulator n=1 Tax=Paraburkholderia oxyphila TaxID=614212 RepID=UPI000487CE4C|nr:helix-turn-helix transcriptional regulator [Paraburkholderia oxyphila]